MDTFCDQSKMNGAVDNTSLKTVYALTARGNYSSDSRPIGNPNEPSRPNVGSTLPT